jgi:hypothetical protein
LLQSAQLFSAMQKLLQVWKLSYPMPLEPKTSVSCPIAPFSHYLKPTVTVEIAGEKAGFHQA